MYSEVVKQNRVRRASLLLVSVMAAAVLAPTPAQAAAGPQGRCLHLSAYQYLESDAAIIPTNGAFTVSMWIYLNDNFNSYAHFISQGGQPNGFYLGVSPDLMVRAGDRWLATGYRMKKGEWTHLTLTRSTAGRGALYINGSTSSYYVNLNYVADSISTNTRLGAQYLQNAPERMDGCLDNVAVYSRELSNSEISWAYSNSELAPTTSGLVSYFTFENGSSGTSVFQAAGTRQANFKGSSPIQLISPVPSEIIIASAQAAQAAAAARSEAQRKALEEQAAILTAISKAALERELAEKAAAAKAAAAKAAAKRVKTTITCVKGTAATRVTGINPKCPAGFKRG